MRCPVMVGAIALLAACAAPAVAPPEAPARGEPDTDRVATPRVLELILRGAGQAAPDGTPGPALRQAADTAAQWLAGGGFPLDAWSSLARRGEAPSGTGSPVERIAAERLAQAGRSPEWSVPVWTPEWRDGALVTPPPAGPGPLLVDLLAPRLDGERWVAGILLASNDPAAAAAVVEFTLAARARHRAPDLDRIAAKWGLDPDELEWFRAAVAEPAPGSARGG